MPLTTEESVIIQKTRELCQSILEHPEFQTVRRQVDAFLANEEAKWQYQTLVEKGEFLDHKQNQGVQISDEEISEFERLRQGLIENPVAKGFLDAQQEMQKIQDSVRKYVSKTLELGRLPGQEDFDSSCGSGCGCHGH